MSDANVSSTDEERAPFPESPLYAIAGEYTRLPRKDPFQQDTTDSTGLLAPLKTLFSVEWELARADSLDMLCLRAIELGCERLGFDRLGLWFFDAQQGVLRGSFGMDEQGRIRDERHIRLEAPPKIYTTAFLENREPLVLLDDTPLYNDKHEIVGTGQHVTAAVWDGETAQGILSADNLLTGKPITEHEQEILIVYASVIGFLYSRLRAEATQRSREAMYHQAISSANGVVYQLEFGTSTYVHMDEGIERLIGYRPEEVTPALWSQIGTTLRMHGELAGLSIVEATRRFRAGDIRIWTADYVCKTRQGELCWLSDSAIPLRDSEGVVTGCLGILQDITERLLSERALRESEERYRAAVTGSSDGLYDVDLDTDEVYYSPRFLELLGYTEHPDELASKMDDFDNHIHPDDQDDARNRLEASLTTGVPFRTEYRLRTRSGEYRWFQLRGDVLRDEENRPVRLAGFITDITESRQMQEQLLQAQKLESIGRLAGGVAHDFNNLLTAIMGYADLAKAGVPEESEQATFIDNIIHAGERATDLTRQLLAFARKQIIAPEVLDMNLQLIETERILRRLIGEHIELITLHGKEPCLVRADPGQLQQILVNLVVNARDAMPNGGTLTLETANVTLDARYARKHLDVTPGSYVMLRVSDTGFGMEEAVQQHVFEPFFTTKGQGKGTGLGLATCHGIVKQNGGHIWVESNPGQGTTFQIFLPQVQSAPSKAVAHKRSLPLTGKETLLLVEDDTLLCNFVKETLQEKGYTVLAASRGEEALQLARDHAGKIDLLITDVVMPQMSGATLASRLVEICPETKILYISGYTDDAIIEQGVLAKGVAFLQKPFSARSIALKVREVLDVAAPT